MQSRITALSSRVHSVNLFFDLHIEDTWHREYEAKLRSIYWWPAMDAEAEHYVRHCNGCQASSNSADKVITMVSETVPIPSVAWMKLALDITGPFVVAPSTQRYIVAAIDYTSKFAAIHSCADITSPSIMQWLDNLFSEFGLPHQIVTDNTTAIYFNEVVFPNVLGSTSHLAFPQHFPPP